MTARTRTTTPQVSRRWASLQVGADYADTTTRTLERWHVKGLITIYRAGPRMRRVDLNELDEIIRPIPAGAQPSPIATAGSNGQAR